MALIENVKVSSFGVTYNDGTLNVFLDGLEDTVDNLQARGTLTTPEQFGAVGDGVADDTTAVQAALDSGDMLLMQGTYKVSSILNSKGQSIVGPGKISTTRYNLDELGAVSAASGSIDVSKIKMMYLESAYDLSELLYIKSLGINCINHYCYFNNNGTIDSQGTVQKLLDNALTAGLGVNLGTESDAAKADLAAFVTASTSHPAVIGYSVYDEPGARGISVADQESKITTLRAVTKKSLSMVDQLPAGGGPFEQYYSTNYDLVLCNSYSLIREGLSVADAVEQDLIQMRLDFGGIGKMTGNSRVVPVVAAFRDPRIFGTVEQMLIAGEIFGQAGNGEFGAFVWDGVGDPGITQRVRDTAEFRELVRALANKQFVKPFVTEAYLFGGNGTQKHWPLNELLQKTMPVDRFTTDGLSANNAWPTRVRTGSGNGDHVTTQAGVDMSGICFKRDGSVFGSTIRYRKGFSAWVQFLNANGGAANSGSLFMAATDTGIDNQLVTNTVIASGAPYKFGMTRALASTVEDKMLQIQFNFGAGTVDLYRNCMRGLFVVADW